MPKQNMATVNRRRGQAEQIPPARGDVNRKSNKKCKFLKNQYEKIYSNTFMEDDEWQPGMMTVCKLLLSFRFCSAIYGVISDCDEVYNYWEPLHLLIYGRGFQTWEYSPIYAIRSYLYIFMPSCIGKLLSVISSKIIVFTLLRCLISVFCLGGEYYLYLGICRRINIPTARVYAAFTIFSSGMFTAGASLLPSSFAMIMSSYGLAAYLFENWWLTILCTATSALLGWPFAALLGLPIVIDLILIHRKYWTFFWPSALFGSIISISLICFDSYHFGKFVFAPINIVLYNVFSEMGPELFGIEPVQYYLKNLFMNWNVCVLLAIYALPLSFVCYMRTWIPRRNSPSVFGIPRSLEYWNNYVPVLMIWFGAAVWIAVFFTTPHKEERFLFPIYPHIAVLAAIGFDATTRLLYRSYGENIALVPWSAVIVFILLSTSRSYAVVRGYGASLEVYKNFTEVLANADQSKMNTPIRICIGKEWHRFPSSFFLPEGDAETKKCEMAFLESEFKGLLPQPFIENNSSNVIASTTYIPSGFNNRNEEDPSRYVGLETCDFVVDSDAPRTEKQLDFRLMKDQFEPVTRLPFLIPEKSNQYARAFYVPFFSDKHTQWTNYTIYQRRR